MTTTKSLKACLVRKLHPRRVQTSPVLHAILACLLGQKGWTTPSLTSVICTSDGHLLGCRVGDYGYNDYLTTRSTLLEACTPLSRAAKLTPDEQAQLIAMIPDGGL